MRLISRTLVLVFILSSLIAAPTSAQRAPRIEAFELRGALSPKAARPLVIRALPGLARCFDEAKAEGRLGARLLIVADGSVLAAEIDSSSISDRAIERCLIEKLRAIRFPSVADFEESHLMVRIGFGASKNQEHHSSAGPGDPRFSEGDERAPQPEAASERDVKLSVHLREGAPDAGARALIESRLDRAARSCQRAGAKDAKDAKDAHGSGRISLRVTIDAEGRVASLRMLYSNAAQTLERCVLERTSRLIFPAARAELDAQFLFIDLEPERRAPSR